MAKLICIDPAFVQRIWPLVSTWLLQAMRRGDLGKFSELENDVLSGGALLWVTIGEEVIESAIVTQIGIVESGRVCVIVACGGRCVLDNLSLLSGVEEYARREGCRKIRIMGRKGWARALQEYKQTRVVLERELN